MENKLLVCVEPVWGAIETWQIADGGWKRTIYAKSSNEFADSFFVNGLCCFHEGVIFLEWLAAGPEENGREVLGEL